MRKYGVTRFRDRRNWEWFFRVGRELEIDIRDGARIVGVGISGKVVVSKSLV